MKFFAEGLPRLGVVNVQIELDSPSSHSISVSTTVGEFNIVLRHDGEVIVPLPFDASSTETLTIPPEKSVITVRVPTVRSTSYAEPLPLLSAEDIQTQRSQGTTLSCASCHKKILCRSQMRWKDLPSDSWIEFSDYWLCHPGNSHSHSHAHAHTPTPVLPTLKAAPGTVLVGLTSLLIHHDDSLNITVKVCSLP